MKSLIRIALVLLFGICLASAGEKTITLAWDASPDATITNYCLYVSKVSGAFANSPDFSIQTNLQPFAVTVNTGTNLTAVVQVPPSTRYYFVVTAQAGGLESNASNEVGYTNPPSPPSGLTIRLLP